ncbi:MAG: DNA-3-methyladenine glycosylase 2 family protein, partial [Verrucomicrobia bacterium]|nr:DNA-3-methyladenine glycosylase 2 family protein [Verrucomicrobiota bacterium]
TLASFICSSSKQIVQIRQIVAHLCRELGEPVQKESACISITLKRLPFERYTCNVQTAEHATPGPVAFESEVRHAFPSVSAVARATEARLRGCKLGFRAKYLLAAARMIESDRMRLDAISGMEYLRAVEELTKLPGVGPKIADCALLFAWGRQEAFPMDVWIERALRRLYFPDKPRVLRCELAEFARSYFGPHAGYAQQYLFHYVRHHPQVVEARVFAVRGG